MSQSLIEMEWNLCTRIMSFFCFCFLSEALLNENNLIDGRTDE